MTIVTDKLVLDLIDLQIKHLNEWLELLEDDKP